MQCTECHKAIDPQQLNDRQLDAASGLCSECWDRPFPITSVCRVDLIERFTPEQIARFTDAYMASLAESMAEAYVGSDFWSDLEIIAERLLEESQPRR